MIIALLVDFFTPMDDDRLYEFTRRCEHKCGRATPQDDALYKMILGREREPDDLIDRYAVIPETRILSPFEGLPVKVITQLDI
jgi:hypothetical protein